MNLTQGFQTPKGLLSNFSTAKIARFSVFQREKEAIREERARMAQ